MTSSLRSLLLHLGSVASLLLVALQVQVQQLHQSNGPPFLFPGGGRGGEEKGTVQNQDG